MAWGRANRSAGTDGMELIAFFDVVMSVYPVANPLLMKQVLAWNVADNILIS